MACCKPDHLRRQEIRSRLATSCRRYVTVDGQAEPEQNLAAEGHSASVADRLEFLPQLQLLPPPP